MKFYFAPMEGITGYVFRNAHHRYFPGITKYFSPFIQPNQTQCLRSREIQDILPEHNEDIPLVPQILTNSADSFVRTAGRLKQLGYREVNLNLGCPSRTVVSKGRGCGFLADPARLRQFLDDIFSRLDMEISIKTRIGLHGPEEFAALMELYLSFPLKELIIHPRIQPDYYSNVPNLDVFADALRSADRFQPRRLSVCYNGDLFTQTHYHKFADRFPDVDRVMIGRGLLVNPGLVCQLQSRTPLAKDTLKAFHDEILTGYRNLLSGEKNVLFKMKELWFYLIHIFSDSERYAKKIKKAQKLSAYEAVVGDLFAQCGLLASPR